MKILAITRTVVPLIMKSERLKKLESELGDLQQWLKLGLVPKKDIDKHKAEIASVQERIIEENERLQHLKETGEAEEYIMPKRNATQKASGYPDTATIADIDLTEESSGLTETTYDMETETSESDHTAEEGRDEEGDEALLDEEEEEEDPFSDKNRWRRGILDPDADNW